MTIDKLQKAYFEVLATEEYRIPYTQEGADMVYEKIKAKIGVDDSVFYVRPIAETGDCYRKSRNLELVLK
jgi:predicted metalloendopeptidase